MITKFGPCDIWRMDSDGRLQKKFVNEVFQTTQSFKPDYIDWNFPGSVPHAKNTIMKDILVFNCNVIDMGGTRWIQWMVKVENLHKLSFSQRMGINP